MDRGQQPMDGLYQLPDIDMNYGWVTVSSSSMNCPWLRDREEQHTRAGLANRSWA